MKKNFKLKTVLFDRISAGLSLVAVLIAIASPVFAETIQPKVTEVTIVGSLHKYHRDLKHYSFEDLKKLIESKKPEVICIEVMPENYKGTATVKAPYEYREAIMPFLLSTKAEIKPIDWVNDDWNEFLKEQKALSESPKTSGLFNAIVNPLELLVKHANDKSVAKLDYAFYNSDLMDELIEAQYEVLVNAFPGSKMVQIADKRNENIANLLIEAVKRNKGKRILVLIGMEHKFALKKRLRVTPGVKYVNIIDF